MIGYDLLILAFTTGMVVTVNPCGFAMLPAYLSFFVGAETDTARPVDNTVRRAVVVATAMTVGFVATFAVTGLTVNLLSDAAYQVAPWISVVIGLGLVGLGLALLIGFQPIVRLPHLERGGRNTNVASMILFGASYAVASCGCTLPLFVGTMTTMFGRSLGDGAQYFLAYSLGFGLVITALTVAIAVGHRSVVGHVRRLLPFVHRIAGALLVLTGTYIAYYGYIEVRTGQGQGIPRSTVVDRVSDWSSQTSNWMVQQGGETLGAALLLIVIGAIAIGGYSRARHERET
jgi:cytochrome c biogenesis protein CcdA